MNYVIFESITNPTFTVIVGEFAKEVYAGYGYDLYELKMRGFVGTELGYKTTLESAIGQKIELVVDEKENGISKFGDIQIKKLCETDVIDEYREDIIYLPEVRIPEYLFRGVGTDLCLYISASKFKYSYESFKLFDGHIFKSENGHGIFDLYPVRILHVTRYRDGGTTQIVLENDVRLYVPSPFKKNEIPVFNGIELMKMNPDDWVIREDVDGVSLQERNP